MKVSVFLCVCLAIAQAQELITFGTGLSSNRLYLAEVSIALITI